MRADLLHRLGRDAEAAEAYQAALALSENAAEQQFLADRVRLVVTGVSRRTGPDWRGGGTE
jgi:predicted RNA polymerase sigma factor